MVEFEYLLSTVVTTLDTKITNKYGNKYPNLNFITEPQTDEEYSFPNVYVSELESPEIADTMEHDKVGAIKYGIQIQIADNKKQTNARQIAYACVDVLKGMGYKIKPMPIYNKVKGIHTYTLRGSRNIGLGDTI